MDGGHDARLGVDQRDRGAVGDEDDHDGGRLGRDHDVGGGNRLVQTVHPPAPIRRADDGDPGAVHLLGEDQGAQVDPEGACGPLPVGDDPVRHIAHVESQVQRRVRAH